MSSTPERLDGITEDDIANYLVHTPGFFDRHADVLATVQLTHPHSGRAVSLAQRQMDMMRDQVRLLERRIMDMIRAGNDNVAIADKMHRWTCAVMLARNASLLGQVLVEELKHEFMVPQAAVRVWGVSTRYAGLPWAQPVSEDVRAFAASLSGPFCGLNSSYEAANWLGDASPAQSLAMIPLRLGKSATECFGLLVLGSPDALRYQADMSTDFLVQIGDIASAALGRMLVED
ncbi:MAG: hypothetical protein CFE46_03360 [Burkholderiales bacterium PBB6]|uniref:DUF484 family protein n=1 Tax=Ideonella margarita TaxID=2984191 RepID=A0ABU9C284_9BURK|nr:MAG: hypothetical protein CFE46_03360 [Burkholderiales bacterium PBB6]